jgi:hypothetical protein
MSSAHADMGNILTVATDIAGAWSPPDLIAATENHGVMVSRMARSAAEASAAIS